MASGKKLNLNINVNASEVEDERTKYSVNSPTSEQQSDDPERQQYGLNSPTGPDGEYEANYGTAEPEAPVPDFMTQVKRDEKPAAQPVQVEVTPEKNQKNKKTKKTKPSKGWCSCLSAPPSNDDDAVETPQTNKVNKKAVATNRTRVAGSENTTNETKEDIEREMKGLLGRRLPRLRDKKCLVIDLDETLVHSSFKAVGKCDFIVPVEIDHVVHNVYVLVRKGAVEFLNECAKHYEMVLFTASLSKYADPLLDLLDEGKTIDYRLFRDSCVQIGYSYVKDLTTLGRKMSEVMIIDNSPQSYRFQPRNAIPITSWFDDPDDTELLDLLPVLRTTLKKCEDVRDILDASKSIQWLIDQKEEEN